MLKIVCRVLRAIDRFSCFISIVLVLAMAILMNLEVLLRYVFGSSTQISDEYSGYLFIAATMLCFFPTLRRGRFLQVRAVAQRMPLKIQAVFEAFSAICGAFVCFVLCWQTLELALKNREVEAVSLQISETPLWLPQIIVPIGFALLLVGYIDQGVRHFWRLWSGFPLTESNEVDHVLD